MKIRDFITELEKLAELRPNATVAFIGYNKKTDLMGQEDIFIHINKKQYNNAKQVG